MNRTKIKQMKTALKSLETHLEGQTYITTKDMNIWVSHCVAFFSRIGVNDVIISDFIKYYSPVISKDEKYPGISMYKTKKMGNFESTTGGSGDTEAYNKVNESYLSSIAFLTAKNIIQRMEEEERMVPLWIIKELKKERKFLSISSSLNLIEKNYEDRNSDGIIKNAITLLEGILNLDDDVKKIKELSKKLKKLLNDKDKLKKFGISKEFVFALDNSRLVRNIKSVHKTKPMKYDIPFLLATNNAFLIILFLEIVLSSELIIKT
ncbi:hypothetical protein KAR28_06435 [Candidatus Parcubacteria bacterium]|nr:hypothetical protein [Candidatus Parcubacteria bacterium]